MAPTFPQPRPLFCLLIFPFGCRRNTSDLTLPSRTLDFPQTLSSLNSVNASIIYATIQGEPPEDLLRPSLSLRSRSKPDTASLDSTSKHILPLPIHILSVSAMQVRCRLSLLLLWPHPFHSSHLSDPSKFRSDLFCPLLNTLKRRSLTLRTKSKLCPWPQNPYPTQPGLFCLLFSRNSSSHLLYFSPTGLWTFPTSCQPRGWLSWPIRHFLLC